jgi:hypothetical protein
MDMITSLGLVGVVLLTARAGHKNLLDPATSSSDPLRCLRGSSQQHRFYLQSDEIFSPSQKQFK